MIYLIKSAQTKTEDLNVLQHDCSNKLIENINIEYVIWM